MQVTVKELTTKIIHFYNPIILKLCLFKLSRVKWVTTTRDNYDVLKFY